MTQLASLVRLPIAAASSDGDVRELVSYEFRRLAQFDDPRILWALLIAAGVLAVGYVVWLYRRDSKALSPALRLLFPCLRIAAWIGAAMFFLGLERRVDQQVVTDSQVVLLVDTSQSMSVADENADSRQPLSRGEAVAQTLRDLPFVDSLRQRHKVALATFDRELRRVASWNRISSAANKEEGALPPDQPKPLDWLETLQPQGPETRLGDALQQVAEQQRDGPLAGIIVITDGVQNSGLEPLSLVDAESNDRVPIFAVGIGSAEPRRNLRIQELIAPARLPGRSCDRYRRGAGRGLRGSHGAGTTDGA